MTDREALTPRQVGQLLEAAAGTALEALVALAGARGVSDILTLDRRGFPCHGRWDN